MAKQLAFQFDDTSKTKPTMPHFEPVTPPPAFDAIAAYRQRIEGAKTLDVTYPPVSIPDDAYQETEPHLPCATCQRHLWANLYYVMTNGRRFLCLDCFEDEKGLDRFTVDDWLAQQDGRSNWELAPVEDYINFDRFTE